MSNIQALEKGFFFLNIKPVEMKVRIEYGVNQQLVIFRKKKIHFVLKCLCRLYNLYDLFIL